MATAYDNEIDLSKVANDILYDETQCEDGEILEPKKTPCFKLVREGRCDNKFCCFDHGLKVPYKKVRCKYIYLEGSCKYGKKCLFAHSFEELRLSFKVDLPCKYFFGPLKKCPFGLGCMYRHVLRVTNPIPPTPTNSPVNNKWAPVGPPVPPAQEHQPDWSTHFTPVEPAPVGPYFNTFVPTVNYPHHCHGPFY